MFRIKSTVWRKSAVAALALLLVLPFLVTGCGQGAPAAKKTAQKLSPATQLAAQRGYVLIGMPTPATGADAAFGGPDKWVVQECVAAMNKDGGIYVKALGKKLPVKVKMVDTQSSPSMAAQVATELVTKDKVDLMVVLHSPDVVNPVSAIAERYHVPTVAMDDPAEAWFSGGPYHWTFLANYKIASIVNMFIQVWGKYAKQTDKVVGFAATNDPDGLAAMKVFKQALTPLGYKVVVPGTFPPDTTTDFTAMITLFKKDHADILAGTLAPPVFATLWRQAHEQGYVPKIASIGKALLYPSGVASLGGNLGQDLTCELWWSPDFPFKSSLTGQTGPQFVDAYAKATSQQWTQPMGYTEAALEIAYDALTRAQSVDPEAIREAIAQTDLSTLAGPIKFNVQNWGPTPVAMGQWVKGTKWPWELQIIDNDNNPNIPVTAKMVFPIPR